MATIRAVFVLGAVALLATGCIDASQPVQVTPQIQNGTAGPGLWRSLGGDSCGWRQSTTLRGSWLGGDRINSHGVYGGPVYAQIIDHAGAFTSFGCAPFWLVGGPWDRPLATPGQPFGPGDYRVGDEVAPGTYVAPGASDAPGAPRCVWMRVSAFTFAGDAVIESNQQSPDFPTDVPGPQIATIDQHDFGFSSSGCGPWTKIG